MRKERIKALVLVGAFLLTILVVGMANQHSGQDATEDMEQATLPVISFSYGDWKLDELHGNTAQMNALFMRDAIIPLGEDRVMSLSLDTYGKKVGGLSYEIRSMDMERLVAEAKVEDYSVKKDVLKAKFKIQNIIEAGVEYLFILKLNHDGRDIYYYTRLMQPQDSYVEECIKFVSDFHDTAMNKEAAATLATYLEPNSSADNTTLHSVTIHSSLKQLSWADFKFRQVTDPVISVKEIDNNCNVITMDYTILSEDEDPQYYNVNEYYRVRYTSDRTYLLNYERTMEEIFYGNEDSVYDHYIQLGIRSEDVSYLSNENGTVAAFVQEGDLWLYNWNTNQMVKVFSFRSDKGDIDSRENYGQHDIRIVNVDEGGSVDFLVYGYMNRGIHEGKTGISSCRYDAVTNTVEEGIFIPVTVSYQVMKEDLGELAYQNHQEEFFLTSGGVLYQIDQETLDVTPKRTGLEPGDYTVSQSGQYIAYGEEGSKNVIYLEDLESGDVRKFEAGEGEEILALSFIGEDLICARAREADALPDAAGNMLLPMYQLQIISPAEDYQVVKTYEKEGFYISEVEVDQNTISISRVQNVAGSYLEAPEDTIVNSQEKEEARMGIATSSGDARQKQVQIEMAEPPKEEKFLKRTSKEIISDKETDVFLPVSGEKRYYAYAAGKVVESSRDAAEAVRAADAQMGVVVDSNQRYIWKRSKKTSCPSLLKGSVEANGGNSIEQSLNLILKQEGLSLDASALLAGGESVKEIMEGALKGDEVLDLSGCGVQQTLYYLSRGSLVFAMKSQNEAVVFTGYDASGVYVCDPVAGSVKRQGLEEAENLFAGAGNVFYTYLK